MKRRRLPLIVLLAVAGSVIVASSSSAAGELVFSPASNAFADAQVNTTGSDTQTFTITNQSGADQTINPGGVTKSGANQSAFSLANDTCQAADPGRTLANNDSCSVDVTFTPDATGNLTAELDVLTSDGLTLLGSANVSGNGTPAPAAQIEASPTTWDFGNHKVGTAADSKTFTLQNTGNAGVTLGALSTTGAGFSQPVSDGCSGTPLGPGDTCTVDVHFDPPAAGPTTGSLSIPSVVPATVSLSGNGTVPHASPGAPVSFTAGINKTQTKSVTLTNDGDAELVVSGLPTLSGDDSFTNPGTGNCGNAHLAPGGSCQTNISFTPRTNAIFAGKLTFTDDSGSNAGSQQSIDLTGTVLLPGISSTPVSELFPETAVGRLSDRKVVTITNTGGDDLRVTGVAIGGVNNGSFVLGTNGCQAVVTPNDSCPVNVRFAPAKSGNRIANLIVHNNAGADLKVALTGHAVAPDDVTATRAAAGCSDARFTWQNPDAAGFRVVRLVRNSRRFPRSPQDGVTVEHNPGVALDTAPKQFHVYYYTLFAMYQSWDGSRMVAARGIDARIHTGRICRPRDNSLIRDLTPKVDWTAYPHTRSYAFILQRNGNTIDVRYVRKSSYAITSSWRYNRTTHSLAHGGTYTFYLYAYTSQHPRGVSIGHATWTER